MELSHDPGTDRALITFEPRPGVESLELCDGVAVLLDADEHVVAITIEDASRKLDIDGLRDMLAPEPAAGAGA